MHVQRQHDVPSPLAEQRDKQQRGGLAPFLVELFKFLLIAVVVALPIRIFIAQPFVVSGASMYPSFENSEYLIVDEISYRFSKPQRGDVVVFRYPKNPSTFFIKRIIGLPNEIISSRNGSIFVQNETDENGFSLQEEYIEIETSAFASISLEEDEYFVLGDNRPASSDSRSWGPLPEGHIIGRAFLRLLPIARAEVFPGAEEIRIYNPLP